MSLVAPVLEEAPLGPPRRKLRVAVLVDLMLTAKAGGHVKCWQRLAGAALGFADALDLTVHFIGEERRIEVIGENVRYVLEPPVFSTARVPFLSHVPDHTDLARWHRPLARTLGGYDVIHTTDAYFAYARTAMQVARRRGIPLVTSVHTNTPQYARIFTAQTVERLCGPGLTARLLLDRLGVARYAERRMLRQLAEHQGACSGVLVSRPDQVAAARAASRGPVTLLRRGVDRAFFTPEKRDRAWLAERFGIAHNAAVVLFAGRINRSKNVMLLAAAVADLLDRGVPVHLFCAGQGEQRAAVKARLGSCVTCPGTLDPETLARVYASADLFAFPSPVEECANVVLEALASGLPVLVANESGMGRMVVDGETGYSLPSTAGFAWARFIALLVGDHGGRALMANRARRYAEQHLPSWAEVLAEDLLPQWQQAAMAPPRPA